MERRTFLNLGSRGVLGGALATCGGDDAQVGPGGAGGDSVGSPVVRPWRGNAVTGWIVTAAGQSGMSRVYGGIHFDNANLTGQGMERRVGAQSFAKARRSWQGVA